MTSRQAEQTSLIDARQEPAAVDVTVDRSNQSFSPQIGRVIDGEGEPPTVMGAEGETGSLVDAVTAGHG